MHYVIIGNSYSGVSAVEAIREADPDGEITIISNERYSVYSRPLISYYLAGKVDEEGMCYRPKDFYKKMNVNAMLGRVVIKVDTGKQIVTLSDGDTVSYNKLLIATGGKPFVPPMKGVNAKGVFTFTTFDDAKNLYEAAKKTGAKHAVIIGGGLIGLKACEGVKALGLKVTIVELGERVLALALDEEAGKIVGRRLKEEGINIITGHTVNEILGDEDGVCGVILDDGRKMDCELVVVAIGVRPNIDLIKDTGIKVNRGIVTDEYMQTSVKDVYAAGDVTESYDMVNCRGNVIAIVPLAYDQGRIAGYNMAGVNRKYAGGMSMNSVEIYGIPVMTMGMTLPDKNDENNKKEILAYNEKGIYRKFIIDDGVLVGAILVGEVDYGGILTFMVRNKMNINHLKENLIKGDFQVHIAEIESEISNFNFQF